MNSQKKKKKKEEKKNPLDDVPPYLRSLYILIIKYLKFNHQGLHQFHSSEGRARESRNYEEEGSS